MVTLDARPQSTSPANGLEFDRLYEECAQPIFNFVLRSVRDSEQTADICQEVWTKAYTSLESVREATSARAWLYRIAKHVTIDAARQRASRPQTTELDVDPATRPSDDPLQQVVHSEEAALAWQTLAALPERQQMALYLKEVDGRCYREIAEILECSESAVETLLVRARHAFAARYQGLAADRPQRCAQARHVMSTWVDGEGSPVLRHSLAAHLNECRPCRERATNLQQGVAARATVPMLPLPVGGAGILGAGAAAAGSVQHGLRTLIAYLLQLLTAKAATVAVTAVAAGTIAIAAAVGAQDSVAVGASVQSERSTHDIGVAITTVDVTPDSPTNGDDNVLGGMTRTAITTAGGNEAGDTLSDNGTTLAGAARSAGVLDVTVGIEADAAAALPNEVGVGVVTTELPALPTTPPAVLSPPEIPTLPVDARSAATAVATPAAIGNVSPPAVPAPVLPRPTIVPSEVPSGPVPNAPAAALP